VALSLTRHGIHLHRHGNGLVVAVAGVVAQPGRDRCVPLCACRNSNVAPWTGIRRWTIQCRNESCGLSMHGCVDITAV